MNFQFIEITNLQREYTWENYDNHSPSGKREEWDEISTVNHRNEEIGVFHPLILDFYREKNEPWFVKSNQMLGKVYLHQKKPLIIDLRQEHPVFPADFDFNKNMGLALLCSDIPPNVRPDFPLGFFGTQYLLLPLKKGEYKEVTLEEATARTGRKMSWLNSFEALVQNNVIRIEDIPIEIIK